MAYTIPQFITQATGGGAVQITKAAGPGSFNVQIGGRSILMSNSIATKVAPSNSSSGVPSDSTLNTSVIDLGTLFTANQVLDSFSLRQAIISGAVIADAGTVALARNPVV